MPFSEVTARKIILENDPSTLVDEANKLGEQLAKDLKTSQLRNVYGAVRQAALRWDNDRQKAYQEIILLQPKLAYYTQRAGNAMRPLKEAMDEAIKLLRQDSEPHEKHFRSFVDFCEAIVAYHRFYRPGKD
jgi:CRISPR type III-A-associated protein Csm2